MDHSKRIQQLGRKNIAGAGRISSVLASLPLSVNSHTSATTEKALQERLEELLVFELKENGERRYLTFSTRGLYRHVISCITTRRQEIPAGSVAAAAASEISRRSTRNIRFSISPEHSTMPTPHQQQEPLQYQRGADAEVTYRERLGGYLHPRDMRRLVTPFSTSNEPDLIVRRHVMLFNFDPLRAIVLRDRLLVIVPDGADSILVQLEQRVRGGVTEMEKSIFGTSHGDAENENATGHGTNSKNANENPPEGAAEKGRDSKDSALSKEEGPGGHDKNENAGTKTTSDAGETDVLEDSSHNAYDDDGEWDELERKEWINLPFELQCADAVLNVVCGILATDTNRLNEVTVDYIHRILNDSAQIDEDPLTIIRAVKDSVREMTSRVKGFVKSMTRILDEDEDMALMNLSRLLTHPERFIQPVPPEVLEEESDEPELILEANMQIALTLLNALDLIQGQIDTVSELINQKLDTQRNKILYANMVIMIITLCVASTTMVAGFYGMNIPNPHDADNGGTTRDFHRVTYTSSFGSFVLGIVIMLVLSYTGTMPSTRFGSKE